jgi:hypothetical protein
VTPFGRLGAALAVLLIPRPPPLEKPVAAQLPSVAEAIEAATRGRDAIAIGFGELHQVVETAGIPSSLRRFTADVLPALAPRASDLIVETWVADGRCGEREASVVADVERTTQRPETTESEIVALLRRAKESGVRPHILRVSCVDYERLAAGAAGRAAGVDYQRMLALTEAKLEQEIRAVLAARAGADAAKLVLVYGGALHNDLHPDRLLAPFSYGPAIFRATAGRYVEVDLYVPEYLERNAAMHAEPWYPVWQASLREAPTAVHLIRRSPASAIIILPPLAPPRR